MKRLVPAVLALPFALALSASAQMAGMAAKPATKTMAAPSTSLTINTGTGQPLVLTRADLKALPQQTVSVHNVHANDDESYSGPLLSDILAKAGVVLSEQTEHPMLHQYIVAAGTDKYWVLYSMAEVQPGLHNAKVIVAIARSGEPLKTSGQFELINTVDVKPARWVHNVTSITVTTPTP